MRNLLWLAEPQLACATRTRAGQRAEHGWICYRPPCWQPLVGLRASNFTQLRMSRNSISLPVLSSDTVVVSEPNEKPNLPEHGQKTDKTEKAPDDGCRKLLIALVAGGGFEPPTFGL